MTRLTLVKLNLYDRSKGNIKGVMEKVLGPKV